MSKAALYQKIVKVMNEVGQLVKDGTVTDFSGKKMYSYLSEEQTTAELQQAFIKHGLVMFPIKVEDELFYIETVKKGGEHVKAPITRVRVTYKICDADTGESEELQSIGYGSDSQDKGSNKAMTGAFKYVQRQTFMISTGDDGDHTSSAALDEQYKHQTQSPQTPQQPRTAPQTNVQNDTGSRQQSTPTDPSKRVYGLMNSMNWGFDDLSRFASEVFGKEIRNLKNQIKEADEWSRLYKAMEHYKDHGTIPA